MKKIIYIAVFIVMVTGAFFFYNSTTIADDKDGKCCNGKCTTSEKCNTECKSECSTKNGKSSGSDIKECPYMSGKSDVKKQSSECPYKSGSEYKHEGTKKSGTCPYMKKETEVKI